VRRLAGSQKLRRAALLRVEVLAIGLTILQHHQQLSGSTDLAETTM